MREEVLKKQEMQIAKQIQNLKYHKYIVQNELKKIQEGINSVTPTKPPKPQKDIECEKSPLETTEITPIKQ
jgi:hypothetical protein